MKRCPLRRHAPLGAAQASAAQGTSVILAEGPRCPDCGVLLPDHLATLYHENSDPTPEVHLCGRCGAALTPEGRELRRLTRDEIASFSSESKAALVRGLLLVRGVGGGSA